MPETSVHKDHFPAWTKNEIGFSRKVFAVQAVAIAKAGYDQFDLGSSSAMKTSFSGYMAFA